MTKEEMLDLLIRVYYGLLTVPGSSINTIVDLEAFKSLLVRDLNWGRNNEEVELSKLRASYKIAQSIKSLEIEISQSRILEGLSMNVTNRECVLHWLSDLGQH
jgi:hypothetical protein